MKEKAENALREIYDEYKDRGILAVYLWGSIITADYDPMTSDVDSIAIVADETPIALEEEIQQKLAYKFPKIHKFGFRMLWLSELNDGKVIGNLATYIEPKLLLQDFPNWQHEAGKAFFREDFLLPVLPIDMAIGVRLKKIRRDNQETVSAVSLERHMYFLKEVSRIIYLLQQKRGSLQPFSYSGILAESNDKERCVVDAILRSKNSNWDQTVFSADHALYQDFLDRMFLEFANQIAE